MAEFSGHLLMRAEPRENGRTVLARQSFCAPFHLGKPYWDEDGRTLMAQVVNPTAGILEGDRLELDIGVAAGASLLVVTPSVSRVFHMRQGEATGVQRLAVAAGGWLEFLPEPLVPHRASRYRQATEIAVAEGGELVFADFLTPGRIARGETWAWTRLKLELTVRVAGELILRERLDQSGGELQALAALAGAENGVCCFGNLVLVSAALGEGGAWREALERLHGPRAWIGVSELRGKRGGWSVKIVAADGAEMRRLIGLVRGILAERLPRMGTSLRRV
jgi:urease accessory protein